MTYPEQVEIPGALLRRWDREADLPALRGMAADPQVMEFLSAVSDAELAAMTARLAAHWDDFGFGLWALCPDGGASIGWVGACHPRWHPEFEHRVELAWGFQRSGWGRGFATSGARAAVEAGFDALGLEELLAFIDPGNGRSEAVARRLGMQLTGQTSDPRTGTPLNLFTLPAPAG